MDAVKGACTGLRVGDYRSLVNRMLFMYDVRAM
jgi:hypothetical protein